MTAIDLMGDNPNVSVTIKANDLTKAFKSLVDSAIQAYKREVQSNPDDILYTQKQVCEILSVDKSTVWRWGKIGYLVPIKVGDLLRYKKSQIDELINNKEEAK